MTMINTARIGNLLDQNVPVEYKIIQGTIITMIFCRIGTGKSTHAHAQWYNSLSVGNSHAALVCHTRISRGEDHRQSQEKEDAGGFTIVGHCMTLHHSSPLLPHHSPPLLPHLSPPPFCLHHTTCGSGPCHRVHTRADKCF